MRKLAFAAMTTRTDVLAAIRKLVPSLPLAELKERLRTGEPFLELHDWQGENTRLVREVLSALETLSVEPIVYKLRSGEPGSAYLSARTRRISVDVVRNMLARAEETAREVDEDDELAGPTS